MYDTLSVDVLCRMVDPAWHVRHGAMLGALALIRGEWIPVLQHQKRRAAWIGNEGAVAGTTGATSIRFEVRTFFARSGRSVEAECVAAPSVIDGIINGTPVAVGGVTRNASEYGVVNLTTVIRRVQ